MDILLFLILYAAPIGAVGIFVSVMFELFYAFSMISDSLQPEIVVVDSYKPRKEG